MRFFRQLENVLQTLSLYHRLALSISSSMYFLRKKPPLFQNLHPHHYRMKRSCSFPPSPLPPFPPSPPSPPLPPHLPLQLRRTNRRLVPLHLIQSAIIRDYVMILALELGRGDNVVWHQILHLTRA